MYQMFKIDKIATPILQALTVLLWFCILSFVFTQAAKAQEFDESLIPIITNTKLADMTEGTLKMRNTASTGDPQDTKISELTEDAAPASGGWFIFEQPGGELRRVDSDNMPGSGAGTVAHADTTGQTANDHHVPTTDTNSGKFTARVNEAGGVSAGQVVTIETSVSGVLEAALADMSDFDKVSNLAVVTEDGVDNDLITVQTAGILEGIDTSGLGEGSKVYFDTSGDLTESYPTTSRAGAQIGVVESSSASGSILIDIQPLAIIADANYITRFRVANLSDEVSAASSFTASNDTGSYLSFSKMGSNCCGAGFNADEAVLFNSGGGDTVIATVGSQNQVWRTGTGFGTDRMTLDSSGDLTLINDFDASVVTVDDDAYAVGWDGSLEVATKNAIYDKIETLSGGGSGDMLAANNLSDLVSAATSRTNLGVEIGVDVQAFSAVLDATTASFLTADETKLDFVSITQAVDLDTIESDTATNNAKVTADTSNVTAAGALMDSEVTNLAQVKAFDSSDYATAAQGTLADNAVANTGAETVAGVKTFSSSPIVPAPTTDLQAATKKYVDDLDNQFTINFGSEFLLDPNEVVGWSLRGIMDDRQSTDLGDVGDTQFSQNSGGLVFPFDVKITGLYAWHRNSNTLAEPWGWVLFRQNKTADSTTRVTTVMLDESDDRGGGISNGAGLRDYDDTNQQETDLDLSSTANNVLTAGDVLTLAVGAPTAAGTNYYVQVLGGYITFEKQ